MMVQKYAVNDIGVAVDVGSTSIGVCCVDLTNRVEILSFSFINPQHIYGADVITRIKYCVNDSTMLHQMHITLEEELHMQLKNRLKEQYHLISCIVYCGNPTMLHILQELSLDGFAQAPFIPTSLEYIEQIKKCTNNGKNADVTNIFLPGFSAFVGADILAGAHVLRMGQSDSYEMLIDLGTNGELLLLNNVKGYATSTACGPVFDHVISGARYGSESMKVIANCVKRGLIDATGKLADVLFDKGIVIEKNMIINQENIRNFQLAKGAIYAGVHCLLKKAGIQSEEVSKVYISGGFGFYMNQRDAFTLKLLPETFKGKITVCENTSLQGAKMILLATKDERKDIIKEYERIRKRTESLELANHALFQKIYMNSLNF